MPNSSAQIGAVPVCGEAAARGSTGRPAHTRIDGGRELLGVGQLTPPVKIPRVASVAPPVLGVALDPAPNREAEAKH